MQHGSGNMEELPTNTWQFWSDIKLAESLQILNHLPTSLVELHLLIEDLEKRIPEEEKQMEFLRMLSQYSGREVEAADEGDEEEEETNDMEE